MSNSSVEGCFNVAALFEFFLEGPSSIFRDTCCSWNCSVSDVCRQLILIVSLSDNNQHVLFLIEQLCVVLFTWCWSCTCTSSSRDFCLQNQSKSSGFIFGHALGKQILDKYLCVLVFYFLCFVHSLEPLHHPLRKLALRN